MSVDKAIRDWRRVTSEVLQEGEKEGLRDGNGSGRAGRPQFVPAPCGSENNCPALPRARVGNARTQTRPVLSRGYPPRPAPWPCCLNLTRFAPPRRRVNQNNIF